MTGSPCDLELELIRELIEGSIDATIILDPERRLLAWNRAYEALCGRRGRQLQQLVAEGGRCFEVFSLDICATACLGQRACQARRPLRMDELGAVRGDGEQLRLIVSATPIGERYLIESYRDVTGEARVQERLKVLLERERRAKAILEEEVAVRTRELQQAQDQLVQQEKMSSLGRLVAGIAHELNNPINYIFGNVDYLAEYLEELIALVALVDGTPDLPAGLRGAIAAEKERMEYDFLVEDSRKLIRSIRAGADRTASIVRDLKDFSRAGGGDRRELDVIAGIETSLNLLTQLFKNRITVERHYADAVPRILCNGGHINQVFMNILTNAAQAIEGSGQVRIEVEAIDEGEAIRIAVTDSGRGIPPDMLAKIADPFFTTKEVGEGTGLGLWITASIIQAHGGKMRWSSQPGQGTTFEVVLPRTPPEEQQEGIR